MYKAALENSGSVLTLSKSVDSSVDPIALLQRLSSKDSTNRMLLESCEIDSKSQLKSILMNKAALRIECMQQQVTITSLTANGNNALIYLAEQFAVSITNSEKDQLQITVSYPSPLANAADGEQRENIDEESRLKRLTPIDCLRKINQVFHSKSNQTFAVFLCGLFSFDFIASFEDLPEVPFGDNDCPDYVFYLAEELIVFNHQTQQTNIIMNIFSGEDSDKNYYELSRRIEIVSSALTQSGGVEEPNVGDNCQLVDKSISVDISNEEYEDIVVQLKKEIVSGNVFQVVPSRTFSLECNNTLSSYQHLKEINPSPYMFYMQDQEFVLFGASPESALKFQKSTNKVELYPIAGTRGRGKFNDGQIDHDLDKRLEVELKLDTKEISEHMMLVDLARNDIARISDVGSLEIPRLLEVDRYSQVMHLVSCVQGSLKSELDCFHAYQACMNMGTLTGAPKIKATELIRKTENKRRGSYGGAVGYIDTHGDMDTCIVIRSAYCKNGTAHIQAGAGIVFDSQPKAEADETRSKANAVIHAISLSEQALSEQALSEQELSKPRLSIKELQS